LTFSGKSAVVGRPDPKVIQIGEQSLYASERAEIQFEKYRAIRAEHQKWFAKNTASLKRDAQGNISAQELEKMPPDIRNQALDRERKLTEEAEMIQKSFQKALDLDRRNYRAAYGMAQLLHRIQPDRPEEAIRFLESAVEVKPDYVLALNDLGASRILAGDFEGAEEVLRKALAIEDLGSYHYNLALALFHQKKAVDARTHFEEALAKGGSSVRSGEVYYYIVSTFIDEGKLAEARQRFGLYRDQIPAGLRETLVPALR
jgi:tetratricopeptide (TPR) repeat protein